MRSIGDAPGQRSEDSTCHALQKASGYNGTLEVMKLDPRYSLGLALQVEQPQILSSKQQICIGHPHRLDILKGLTSLNKELDAYDFHWGQLIASLNERFDAYELHCDQQTTSLKERIDAYEHHWDQQNASLQAKVAKVVSQDMEIANRIPPQELADTSQEARIRMPTSGSEMVDGGDVAVDDTFDAMPLRRTDSKGLKVLDGLLPETVLQNIRQ